MPQPPHIFARVLTRVHNALAALERDGVIPAGLDHARVLVEPPRDASHGDMATNAAMVLAKDAKKKPREIADAFVAVLARDALFAKVEAAGPGFINLTLVRAAWLDELRAAIAAGDAYGRGDVGGGHAVNVEYVSVNPTGPMHVGHGRGAVFGDAIATLLAFTGHAVTREYYINDAGAQVDVLARSAYLRYREALGETITIPEGLYPGDYLKAVGEALAASYGERLLGVPEAEWLPLVRDRAIGMMMAQIGDDLAALNVRHDVFFSERSLTAAGASSADASPAGSASGRANETAAHGSGQDSVASAIQSLRDQGYVYTGRLPPPKGAPVDDWEDREQVLFRSTAFGDDVDRPLLKSEGSYTYFASDIAYHKSKIDRGFKDLIDVWGADHGGYVKRIQAAIAALSGGEARLDVKLVQLVKLLRAGEPVKMSKRAGDFVTLREVVDEVGRDAVRFMMLYRKNDAPLDFDLAKVIEHSKDNPVFYVQYAHARCQSLFRNAAEALPGIPADPAARAQALADADFSALTDEGELDLIRRLGQYPRIIEQAAAAHEPHRIAFYLYELASALHSHWTKGNHAPHLRFIIQEDSNVTTARLGLIQGVVIVLASGLRLLGVEAPDEMR
ncbi:MAG: arginyl-tRNA synthetase [Variibacter sp.]|jgi:arginyl-tRNA synthetase|nr:arginyl-tRNA synthetase [Variibacter sp.]